MARDFLLGFAPTRADHYEYDTAYKWRFDHYVDYRPPAWAGPAYATHGGEAAAHARSPWADLVRVYGRVVYLPGPLTLVLVLGPRRPGRRRAAGAPETRPLGCSCSPWAWAWCWCPT